MPTGGFDTSEDVAAKSCCVSFAAALQIGFLGSWEEKKRSWDDIWIHLAVTMREIKVTVKLPRFRK